MTESLKDKIYVELTSALKAIVRKSIKLMLLNGYIHLSIQ